MLKRIASCRPTLNKDCLLTMYIWVLFSHCMLDGWNLSSVCCDLCWSPCNCRTLTMTHGIYWLHVACHSCDTIFLYSHAHKHWVLYSCCYVLLCCFAGYRWAEFRLIKKLYFPRKWHRGYSSCSWDNTLIISKQNLLNCCVLHPLVMI